MRGQELVQVLPRGSAGRSPGKHAQVSSGGRLDPHLGSVGQQRRDVAHRGFGRQHVGASGYRQDRLAHVGQGDLLAAAKLDFAPASELTRKNAW